MDDEAVRKRLNDIADRMKEHDARLDAVQARVHAVQFAREASFRLDGRSDAIKWFLEQQR